MRRTSVIGHSFPRKSRAVFRSSSCSSLNPKSIVHLPVAEHGDAADRARAAEVVCQAELGVLHLPAARLVPELLADLVDHAHAGGTDWMAERLEPAARVHRHGPAVDVRAPLGDVARPLARRTEAEVLVVEDLGDREAVVDLAEVEVARGNARLLVCRA